jgi:hypothetical protein
MESMSKKEPVGGHPAHKPDPRLELSEKGSVFKRGPRRVKHGVADADKVARTGSKDEPVRDTPPAGAWNDTSGD